MKAAKSTFSNYPYGMIMPNRSNAYGAGVTYRYAYNGMERDNEVSGAGNSYTTEFRQYDPRLGRWKSLDPLMAKFPHMSPYNAFDNNPIYYIDPLGLASTNGGSEGDPPPGQANQKGEFKEGDYKELPQINIVGKKLPSAESEAEKITTDLTNSAGSAKNVQKDPGKYIENSPGLEGKLFNYNPQSGEYDRSSLTHLGSMVEKNLQNQGYLERHSPELANVFSELSKNASSTTELELISKARENAAKELQGQMMMGVFDPENVGTILFISFGTGGGNNVTKNTLRKSAFRYLSKPKTHLNPFELEMTHGLTRSKSAMEKLKADIIANGIREPIEFVEHKGIKYVVNGHHRLRIAKELGMKSVPVKQVSLPHGNYKNVMDLMYTK